MSSPENPLLRLSELRFSPEVAQKYANESLAGITLGYDRDGNPVEVNLDGGLFITSENQIHQERVIGSILSALEDSPFEYLSFSYDSRDFAPENALAILREILPSRRRQAALSVFNEDEDYKATPLFILINLAKEPFKDQDHRGILNLLKSLKDEGAHFIFYGTSHAENFPNLNRAGSVFITPNGFFYATKQYGEGNLETVVGTLGGVAVQKD